MPEQEHQPHPHIDMKGGFVRICDDEGTFINGLLRGLKNKEAQYVFGFDGLKHRCHRAEAVLNAHGIPTDYWDGITFCAYSKGPGTRYTFPSVVGIGVKVQRREKEWVLLDAYKADIVKDETAEPYFFSFTPEQSNQMTDFSDNHYRRPPEIRWITKK